MTIALDPSTLLQWSRVLVRGPQSTAYLQGQLTQDVVGLDERGAWSLLLEPDSAVVSSCFVRRVGSDYELSVARELGEATLARLRRFHLRVDCTLELLEAESGPFSTLREMLDARMPGPRELAARLTPHAYGAGLVATTVSFTKGCFTGQELVGRLDARGSSVPWRLVYVTGSDVARIDEVVRSFGPSGPQGVTTSVSDEGRVLAFAIAHRTILAEGALDAFDDVTVDVVG